MRFIRTPKRVIFLQPGGFKGGKPAKQPSPWTRVVRGGGGFGGEVGVVQPHDSASENLPISTVLPHLFLATISCECLK